MHRAQFHERYPKTATDLDAWERQLTHPDTLDPALMRLDASHENYLNQSTQSWHAVAHGNRANFDRQRFINISRTLFRNFFEASELLRDGGTANDAASALGGLMLTLDNEQCSRFGSILHGINEPAPMRIDLETMVGAVYRKLEDPHSRGNLARAATQAFVMLSQHNVEHLLEHSFGD